MLILVNLVTGSIWGRNQWGIWWAWDLRLTTQLMCFLLYLGYLLMRPAIAEPTQRATMSRIHRDLRLRRYPAGLSWRSGCPTCAPSIPAPVLETGKLAPIYWPPFVIGMLALSADRHRAGAGAAASGNQPARNRFAAPRTARVIESPFHGQDSAMDITNLRFLFYGYSAAWLIVICLRSAAGQPRPPDRPRTGASESRSWKTRRRSVT